MTIREQIDKRLAYMSATKPQHTPEQFNTSRPYRVIEQVGHFTVIGGNVHPLEIRGEHATLEAAQLEADRLNDRWEALRNKLVGSLLEITDAYEHILGQTPVSDKARAALAAAGLNGGEK